MKSLKKLHVVIDLETMGTSANAAIVSIEAYLVSSKEIISNFYIPVHLQSSMESGGEVDAEAILWWLQQSKEARADIYKVDYNNYQLRDALKAFTRWITNLPQKCKLVGVWGNGVDFDNIILANSYKRLGLAVPWDSRLNRCMEHRYETI